MNCAHSQKWLIPAAEGALSERDSKALRRHIESCDRCRQELEDIREATSVFRAAKTPAHEPDPDLWSRVERAILAESAMPVAPCKPWKAVFRARLTFGAVGAAATLLIAAHLSGILPESGQGSLSSGVTRHAEPAKPSATSAAKVQDSHVASEATSRAAKPSPNKSTTTAQSPEALVRVPNRQVMPEPWPAAGYLRLPATAKAAETPAGSSPKPEHFAQTPQDSDPALATTSGGAKVAGQDQLAAPSPTAPTADGNLDAAANRTYVGDYVKSGRLDGSGAASAPFAGALKTERNETRAMRMKESVGIEDKAKLNQLDGLRDVDIAKRQKRVADNPADRESLRFLAEAYKRRGDTSARLDVLKKLSVGNSPDAWKWKTELAGSLWDLDKREEALKNWLDAVDVGYPTRTVAIGQAIAQHSAGAWVTTELTRRHMNRNEAHLAYAISARQGKWKEALNAIDLVIALDQHNAALYAQKAEVLQKLGRGTEAEAARQMELRLNPEAKPSQSQKNH